MLVGLFHQTDGHCSSNWRRVGQLMYGIDLQLIFDFGLYFNIPNVLFQPEYESRGALYSYKYGGGGGGGGLAR